MVKSSPKPLADADQRQNEVSDEAPEISVTVAYNVEAMMRAFAVRAAVFLNEEQCPYNEEFDGNDFTATHILGLVDEEPAATCRLRYFADFAKLERVAVRREYRRTGVAAKMIEFALELCRQKGYVRLHGHAEERLLAFWEKFGFLKTEAPGFDFSEHRYYEMECRLDPHPDPVAMGKDPMLLVRREGEFDKPVPLEQAATPPAAGDEQGGEEEAWSKELRARLEQMR